MALEVERLEVGPWPMNCYLVHCTESGEVTVVDPGADADQILALAGDRLVRCTLLTHGHPDHVGALDAIRFATGAPVGLHPADGLAFGVAADFPLQDGMVVEVGRGWLAVAHVPGHTPGSVCLRIGAPGTVAGTGRAAHLYSDQGTAICGDAIFPGGPGHTESPEALGQSLASLARTVFTWPDGVELLPGHGPSTTVGAEREAFDRFVAFDHRPGLCGDVTWR